MPVRLLGDRGEMAGRMVETLINSFNVHVENTAPYRADWKGLVEQQFRLLPARFKAIHQATFRKTINSAAEMISPRRNS